MNERNYCIAVTGDVFRWMIDYGNEDVLNRVSWSDSHSLY
jgi:cation-transporting ATPase 13A3/4/5